MPYKVRAMLLDLTLLFSVAVGLYFLRIAIDPSFIPLGRPTLALAVVVVVWFAVMNMEGAYDERILGTGVQEFKTVTRASFKGFLILCLIALATNQYPPRINLFLGWIGSVALVTLGRKLLQVRLHSDRASGKSMHNVLIVGSQEYAAALSVRFSEQTQLGMRALGYISMHVPDSLSSEEDWLKAIDERILESDVQILIIEDTAAADADLLSKLSWHLLRHDIEVLVAPSFIHQFGPRLEFNAHTELPLLYLDEPNLNPVQKVAKRLFDVAFSIFAIIVLSPILIATAVGILITNFGPVFFIQKRVGLNGGTFKILKFRSMVVNAQDLQESIWQSASEDGANNKAKDDPRVTSIGRFIRKFSIDELPQLFNVLKGDMSIVGPRPIQEVELKTLGNLDMRRQLIKPGLTGLWQINGRSDTTWEERIQLDLEYLQNWSLALDVGIILKTVPVVVSGDGAY